MQAKKSALLFLFLGNFAILFAGMGLFPVLPVYAAQFGAEREQIGLFLAILYLSNAAGPVLTGWLGTRFSQKTLYILIGLLSLPVLPLMAVANQFWQVILLTSILWFVGGANLTLSNLFTGLIANGKKRGKSFSLLALAAPLGALAGGGMISYLLKSQGFSAVFSVLSVVWALMPLAGWLALRGIDPRKAQTRPAQAGLELVEPGWSKGFLLLLISGLLIGVTISLGRLGTSLSMQDLLFSPQAIASTATISGLVAIPVAYTIGALSDRLGRKRFLMLGYALAGSGMLTLSMASQLWHFWLAATLMLVAFCVNGAMTPALATDLLQPALLNQGISRVSAVNSLSGIITFAGSGYALQAFGQRPLYLLVVLFALTALVLLERMPTGSSSQTVQEPVTGEPVVLCLVDCLPVQK